MSKKKSDAGRFVTLAGICAAFAVRKLAGVGWKRVTGKVPPNDLTDPKVTFAEALSWAVLTGVFAEMARFAIARASTRREVKEAAAAEEQAS